MHAIGLDIGGSKTHAVSHRDDLTSGPRVVEAYAGSANVASVGESEALAQLDAVLAGLVAQGHDGTPDVVCAGAAGVDTPAGAERLRALLAGRLPDARILVVHDTELILTAAGVHTGVALIAGTGSVAWGRTADGRAARAGGWGYLLGDEGSGYGIAREAVRHALSLHDAGVEPDALSRALVAECDVRVPGELLDLFYRTTERRFWARRSQAVFRLAEAGDPVAAAIVMDAARQLARLVLRVHERLETPPDQSVVLAGGVLANQPLLRDALARRLEPHDITDLRVLERAPARGALDLARQQLEEENR